MQEDVTVSMGISSGNADTESPLAWGRFRIIEKVGEGGFGAVYRALDTQLQREVALKLLKSKCDFSDLKTNDEADYERALKEARLAARVRHPNVVSVFGMDRHNGRVGFWTEFIRGQTLDKLLGSQGCFGPRESALIGIEICRALCAVHAAGLLHRDVKASNVMREEGGRILLMDFGLCQDCIRAQSLAGTPQYMAPELFDGAAATIQSDIYAVGVLLYHLVTGKYPVESGRHESFGQLFATGTRKHLVDERPDLPDGFVRAVQTALAVKPEARPTSAGELSSVLSEFVGGSSVQQPLTPNKRKWPFLVLAGLLPLIAAGIAIKSNVSETTASSLPRASHDYLQAQSLLVRFDKPGNVDRAIDLLKEVTKRDPSSSLAFACLGRAYYQKARTTRNLSLLDQAQNAANQALSMNGTLAQSYVTLSLVQSMLGNLDMAQQHASRALALSPRLADAHAAMGEVLLKLGRAEGEAELAKARDLAPEDWRWTNLLGVTYLQAGKPDKAAAEFENVVRRASDNAFGYLNLGIARLREEKLDLAEKAFLQSNRIAINFAAFSNLSNLYQLEGRYSDSIQASLKTIELNPDYYLAWGNLGGAYEWTPNGHEKARKAYERAIELAEKARLKNPKDPQLLSNLGAFYAAVGNASEALPLVKEAVALASDDPTIVYRMGEASEILGDRNTAIHWIKEAIRLGFSKNTVRRSPELKQLREDPRFSLDSRNGPANIP